MKVLLLNTYAEGGGAAVAANRMLQGLLEAGVDARMLVASPLHEENKYIHSVHNPEQKISFLRERIHVLFAAHFDRSKLFRFSPASTGIDISNHPWVQWADIIHLHWVQQGFLSMRGLIKLFSLPHKRFYWSLHDFWPITGGCHIPYFLHKGETHFCEKYLSHCSMCPLLNSKYQKDLSYKIHSSKALWPYNRIQFLGVSNAVTNQISTYLQNRPSAIQPLTVPNIINLKSFHVEKCIIKPTDRFRMLFIAARADDPVKGIDYLKRILEIASLNSSAFKNMAEVLIIGKLKHKIDPLPVRVFTKERALEDELRNAYNSAHLTLSTSRYETFGQTLLESIACGTPALAFNVGGTSDIIIDGINGALISPYEIEQYAECILSFFEKAQNNNYSDIGPTISCFESQEVIRELLSIYHDY